MTSTRHLASSLEMFQKMMSPSWRREKEEEEVEEDAKGGRAQLALARQTAPTAAPARNRIGPAATYIRPIHLWNLSAFLAARILQRLVASDKTDSIVRRIDSRNLIGGPPPSTKYHRRLPSELHQHPNVYLPIL